MSSLLSALAVMDGTLILTDMSWVGIKRVLLRQPWIIPGMLVKELSGKGSVEKRPNREVGLRPI